MPAKPGNRPAGIPAVISPGAERYLSDVTLCLGSLMLDLGNGDAVHIKNFNQNDVFNSSSISSFVFGDGTTLTTAELLARGFDIDGTAGADQMRWRTSAATISNRTAVNDETTQAWRIAA